jgi:hypothetical protein
MFILTHCFKRFNPWLAGFLFGHEARQNIMVAEVYGLEVYSPHGQQVKKEGEW